MQSNTSVPIKVYLMTILDNYMFRPLLAIFRLSSRELEVLYIYIYIYSYFYYFTNGSYIECLSLTCATNKSKT